ncbi:amino acid ABC transporter permease [Poseidonibacter lekithochrous]|uniref:amino acid ABC transporter permease n=1 Tax=Poseidonibacter lekithochrous TaxID=1904463 RepID=UPI0008FC4BD2|nr:amino acid ABC transporter permease [Poseidonibacter lekithochrous]QKJ21783.1 amino acid ABC transporter, permease protein [Poseidonibacter lekithochrous]
MFEFDYTFHWVTVWNVFPEMLSAAVVTLEVAVTSMFFGLIIAVFLSLGKDSKNELLSTPSVVWIELARNTPALFQIYMMYFGLGAFGIHLSPYVAVLAALTFNNAGYLAETLRGGFASIPNTQMSASRSLGMSKLQTYWYIILPQVLRKVYHPMTNQMIWAILMTSLGTLVGMLELTGKTDQLQSLSFRTFEFYLVTAIMYFVIAKTVLLGSKLLAYKIFRGDAQ